MQTWQIHRQTAALLNSSPWDMSQAGDFQTHWSWSHGGARVDGYGGWQSECFSDHGLSILDSAFQIPLSFNGRIGVKMTSYSDSRSTRFMKQCLLPHMHFVDSFCVALTAILQSCVSFISQKRKLRPRKTKPLSQGYENSPCVRRSTSTSKWRKAHEKRGRWESNGIGQNT